MELINQICGSLHEVYGAKKQPIKSYTNNCGTKVKIYNLMETKETKKQTQDCPMCEGTGVIQSSEVDSFAEHEALEAIRREGLFSNELNEDDFIQDI